jgi:hypothetical protein
MTFTRGDAGVDNRRLRATLQRQATVATPALPEPSANATPEPLDIARKRRTGTELRYGEIDSRTVSSCDRARMAPSEGRTVRGVSEAARQNSQAARARERHRDQRRAEAGNQLAIHDSYRE